MLSGVRSIKINSMKSSLRQRADKAKKHRCKNFIVVLENPKTLENVGSVIRNVDALGAEKLYVVDGSNLLPGDWTSMRSKKSLNKISASAIRWTFVKVFKKTQDCLDHLKSKLFVSVATSPHLKGRRNFSIEDANFTDKRIAIWFGNESMGISELAVENSEFCVNIPMCGIIESLNLGTSTGIVIYEITKQRRRFLEIKKRKQLTKKQQVGI